MEDDLKKKMEDDLNFKAVLLRLFNNKNLKNKWFWHHRDWPSCSNDNERKKLSQDYVEDPSQVNKPSRGKATGGFQPT